MLSSMIFDHACSWCVFNLCPRQFLVLIKEQDRTEPFPDTISVRGEEKNVSYITMTFAVLLVFRI